MEHILSFLLAISTVILIILMIAIYNYKPQVTTNIEIPSEQFIPSVKNNQLTKYCCQNSNRVYNSVNISDIDYSM